MAQIRIFNEALGKIKPMHAVNNGPIITGFDQWTGNAQTYKAARIPYARNHDASFLSSYGGEHTVDITAIFPNFDADENDPASYDFHFTDEYTQKTLLMGTETFFRLGQRIEHESKKYGIHPPKDFAKWARICEHIIRHLNEGWADGHHFGITYWEIWNEADLDADDSPVRRNWTGTKAQFFDLFATTAKHLKSCFPNLKIGGPGLSNNLVWADELLTYLDERDIKIDFFSWHFYGTKPERCRFEIELSEELLKHFGLSHIESILDEWNWMQCWAPQEGKIRKSMVGAAFVSAMHTTMQKSILSKSMYYDAEPGRIGFCGLFNEYDSSILEKPYYSFVAFNKLRALGTEAYTDEDADGIYTVAATDGTDAALMLTAYENETEAVEIEVSGLSEKYEVKISLLDEEHSLDQIFAFSAEGVLNFSLSAKKSSVTLVEIKKI